MPYPPQPTNDAERLPYWTWWARECRRRIRAETDPASRENWQGWLQLSIGQAKGARDRLLAKMDERDAA